MNKAAKRVQDLEVYKLAFNTAMEICEISKSFPPEERYSLTDQIRRSSRSMCAHLAAGWRKRKYKAVFVHKLHDAAQKAAETQTWLEFAERWGSISCETLNGLYEKYEHIFAMLNNMKRKRRHSVEAFNYILMSKANERPSDAAGGADAPRPTVTRGRKHD